MTARATPADPGTVVTGQRPGSTDVAVIGAGPAGLLAALLLARQGLSVQVLERSSELGVPPGGVVLQPGTLALLGALGLLDTLLDGGTALRGVDEIGPGGETTTANYADLPDASVPFSLAVPLRRLREVLLHGLTAARSAQIHTGTALVGLEQDRDAVRLRTKQGPSPGDPDLAPVVTSAKVVVGADGKYSTTRDLAGLHAEVVEFSRPQLICRLPRPLGWPDRIRSHRGEHPFVVIPSSQESLHVFGDVDLPAPTRGRPEPPTGPDPVEVLAAAIGDRDGELAARIRAEAERVALVRHHTVLVDRWTSGRVALIGDSAHTVHPYAGQGVNLGLHDAVALAATVARTPGDLRPYEDLRRPFVDGFQRAQRSVLDDASRLSPYADDFAALALGQPEVRALLVPTGPAGTAHS